MQATITRLRIICWVGVLIDLLFAIAMVVPSLWAALLGLTDYAPGLSHRVDMGVGAALMLGWSCLLVWTGQDPVRRRGVLALTMFPVLTGISVASVTGVVTGAFPLDGLLWIFGMKVVLFGILTYGYLVARRIAREAV